ncbi:MAG: hypothetical protein ABIV28_03855 [Longimicrobiales bacterium]
MRTHICAAVALLLIAAPGIAQAQCELVRSGESSGSNGGQILVISNGFFQCRDGKKLSADQVVVDKTSDIMSLYGNVKYSDGEKGLTSTNAVWMRQTSLLQARGQVVVTDVKTGSRIYAPNLDYYQKSKNQTSRMNTFGGRGHVVMKQAPKTGGAAASNPNDSSIVDADIIEIIGERTFRGSGNASIARSDLKGYANQVEYDQDKGTLLLATNARIDGDKYDLTGDTISALAPEGQQLREVRASRNALLTSEQVNVESPFLRIYLDSGVVNRMVATRPAASAGRGPVSLPRVLSKAFNVSADSIDAIAPRQQLERVTAIGHAFGERIDTMPPPAAAAALPNVLTNDWLRGDTLRAEFVENPEAKPDSAGRRERMLQLITAHGIPGLGQSASSALRMREPNDSTWRIYYTLADRIKVSFSKGAVLKVDLDGNVRGVFLSPVGAVAVDPKRKGGS